MSQLRSAHLSSKHLNLILKSSKKTKLSPLGGSGQGIGEGRVWQEIDHG